MTIQDAITKAVEGGWKPGFLTGCPAGSGVWYLEIEEGKYIARDQTLLDPLFWQALGKSLAWAGFTSDGVCTDHRLTARANDAQHRLISHLQDGGSIESFFATL